MNNLNWQQHQENLIAALLELAAQDRFLWENNANERSLTHKLGCYLAGHYPRLSVDCEYNREGEITKYLDGERIFPDVIVHSRGNHDHNELVIEAKKEAGASPEADWRKLEALTDQAFPYQYRHGVHLTFCGFPAIDFKVVQDGLENEALTEQLQLVWNQQIPRVE